METMYGSTHTHFEDSFDAVTDMHTAIRSFLKRSAVKVAATGHGTFTEFENVQDVLNEANAWANEAEKVLESIGVETNIVKDNTGRFFVKNNTNLENESFDYIKETDKFITEKNIFGHADIEEIQKNPEVVLNTIARIRSLHVIPGVEAYFEDEARHMVLIAKNEEGYREISRIISESNQKIINGKPITTMEVLKQNVVPGNIVCTSACIGGVFGNPIMRFVKKIDTLNKKEKELADVGYLKAKALEDEYINIPTEELKSLEKITKKAIAEAEKAAKVSGNWDEVNRLNEARELYENKNVLVKSFAEAYVSMKLEDYENKSPAAIIKEYKRQGTAYEKLKEELDGETLDSFCKKQMAENVSLYKELVKIFGKDDFYFEIQNHGLESEKIIYNETLRLANEVGSMQKIIASNDIHLCVTGEDEEELLREIEKRNIAQLGRFDNSDYRDYDDAYDYRPSTEDEKEYYIKSDKDLRLNLESMVDKPIGGFSTYEIVDTAIKNISSVLSSCNVEISMDTKHYPKFCENENEEFDRLVEEGAKRRFPNGLPQEYRERLDREKEVIKSLGYAGYHLIVQDYIAYAKLLGYLPSEYIDDAPLDLEELRKYVDDLVAEGKTDKIGLGIGPGRGSAGGSLCCFCLEITDIDPMKFDLLFERFLNVDRVSMPDIDCDFKTDIRDKVYEYCKAKYGVDNVSKITTKTYLALKGAIKMGSRYGLAKQSYEKKVTDGNPAFEKMKREYFDAADKLSTEATSLLLGSTELQALDILKQNHTSAVEQDILKYTEETLGMFTVTGQHAAGVVISKDPIKDVVPIMWSEKRKSFQIQCEMARAEEYGLLKMDFLGLKNLDIATEICKNPSLNLPKIDIFQTQEGIQRVLTDPDIYREIYSTGKTHGVFQFESDGMKKMLIEFKPESFEDVIILVALYRPGPMDFIPEVIAQKKFRKDPEAWRKENPDKTEPERSITLRNDALEKILESTYGCPVYQEQIMQIFQEMAGYSLGSADVVRRYMSKKKEDKLAYEKTAFVYGDPERGIPGCCKKHGISVKEAEDLFEQMMPFAKYGFNRSHAACYAAVSVYTAYLKYYRMEDFYRVSMDAEEDVDSLEPYYQEAEAEGVKILPPSLDSQNGFTVVKDKVLLRGFASVKGMGNIPPIKVKTTCAETFVKENEDIPLKNIITMAELGLFETTWEAENDAQLEDYKKYVDHNDEAIADFIDENGKDLRAKNVKAAEDRITEKKAFFAEEVKEAKGTDKKLQAVENKKRKPKSKEYLLGSYAILTHDFVKRLQNKVNVFSKAQNDFKTRTFKSELEDEENLQKNKDYSSDKSKRIPAAVAIAKSGKTKNGASFQILTLIDANGNQRVCRNYLNNGKKELKEGDIKYFAIPLGDDIKFKGVDVYDGFQKAKVRNDFSSEKALYKQALKHKGQGLEYESANKTSVEDVLNGNTEKKEQMSQIEEDSEVEIGER